MQIDMIHPIYRGDHVLLQIQSRYVNLLNSEDNIMECLGHHLLRRRPREDIRLLKQSHYYGIRESIVFEALH